jgi:hypothetical protein
VPVDDPSRRTERIEVSGYRIGERLPVDRHHAHVRQGAYGGIARRTAAVLRTWLDLSVAAALVAPE